MYLRVYYQQQLSYETTQIFSIDDKANEWMEFFSFFYVFFAANLKLSYRKLILRIRCRSLVWYHSISVQHVWVVVCMYSNLNFRIYFPDCSAGQMFVLLRWELINIFIYSHPFMQCSQKPDIHRCSAFYSANIFIYIYSSFYSNTMSFAKGILILDFILISFLYIMVSNRLNSLTDDTWGIPILTAITRKWKHP